jgi:HAD superfamily hydrolase (TIGR01549 family)
MIRGVVFDLDGTLVDSRLDFEAMRREMELPSEEPILEALARLDPRQAERCNAILHRHELAGAERAVLLPGAGELVTTLHAHGIRQAIATRNSRIITEATLSKLELPIELVFTRDDGPVKPNPWAAQEACRRWDLPAAEVVVIGDFRFDVECGRAAGCRTVLLTHPLDPRGYPNKECADLVLGSLGEHVRLLEWMESL